MLAAKFTGDGMDSTAGLNGVRALFPGVMLRQVLLNPNFPGVHPAVWAGFNPMGSGLTGITLILRPAMPFSLTGMAQAMRTM